MAKPVKHVFICTQSRAAGHPRGSCAQKGCNDVLQTFWQELQKRNAYDRIAVTYSGCLGPCDQGANVLVYPEGVLYGHVTKDDVAEIFDSHLIDDVPVERLRTFVKGAFRHTADIVLRINLLAKMSLID